MTASVRRRGFLLNLAAESIAPAIGGCAGLLAGGPPSADKEKTVLVERAINFFGPRIVKQWQDWMRNQPRDRQLTALEELADLPLAKAREEAGLALDQFAADVSPEDRAVALEYLCAIPRTLQRSLVLDPVNGGMTLPRGAVPDQAQTLLQLLPTDVPPYQPGSVIPNTPYQLGDLLGTGGFGAVYRATAHTLQHLTFALKFCLDRSMIAMLHLERRNLERLSEASQGQWSERIVKLYGYNLDHPTPFLVYEYVPGGDLTTLLTNLKQQTGRGVAANEALELIRQIVEGLAFAHARGLVHRDLKPANVLVSGNSLKLADFGIGSITAGFAVQHSRIGTAVADQLSSAEQVSLLRGAGTPLYMSPEQRRGEPADPRHDLYSLGVLWYQLLVGDVTRELHPGWAKELSVKFETPTEHLQILERCVGWIDDRPRDAGELLKLLQPGQKPTVVPAPSGSTAISSEEFRAGRERRQQLLNNMNDILDGHRTYQHEERRSRTVLVLDLVIGFVITLIVLVVVFAGFG